MPIPIVPILLFIVIAIISSAAKAKEQQRRQQQAAQQRRQAYPPVHTAPASSAAPAAAPASPAPRPVPQETEAQRRARQDELKRRLEENRRRREQEQQRADQQRAEEQRSRLEKRPMVTTIQTARTEKPVIAHEDDDCGGGSIHDGYHEGVTQFPNGRPPAVAGRLGNRLADEDERIERERVSAENARRVMKRISKLPPLAQGMIYSEILGKPKSEIA